MGQGFETTAIAYLKGEGQLYQADKRSITYIFLRSIFQYMLVVWTVFREERKTRVQTWVF